MDSINHPTFDPIPSTSRLDLLTAATTQSSYPHQLPNLTHSVPPVSSYSIANGRSSQSGPIIPLNQLNGTSPHSHQQHGLISSHAGSPVVPQTIGQSPSGVSLTENGSPSPATPVPGGFSLRKLLSIKAEIEPGKARSHSIAAVFATDPEPEAGAMEFEDVVQAGVVPEIHVASLFDL